MSTTIVVLDNEDMPCNKWTHEDYSDCPMKQKWLKGQIEICGKCGNKIGFNTDDNE